MTRFAPAFETFSIFSGMQEHVFAQDSFSTLLERDTIHPQYKWNLKDIYESEDLWEAGYKWVEENVGRYADYQGKLGNSAGDLLRN